MSQEPARPRMAQADWQTAVSPCYHRLLTELLSSKEFLQCQTFRDQIAYVHNAIPDMPQRQIAALFGVNPGSVANQMSCIKRGPAAAGRPAILDDQTAQHVLQFVSTSASERNPATVNDVLNMLWEDFDIDMLPNTFRKLLYEKTTFQTLTASPMEQDRLFVTTDKIAKCFSELKVAVNGAPPELVLNLDEKGFQRFADARHNAVIVPKGTHEAYYPVSRNESRATFLAAVSANGIGLKPLVIVQRKTIEAELFMHGFDGNSMAIVSSQNGYITARIFFDYLLHILLPYVDAMRKRLQYQGSPVLIMDGCSCHYTQEVNALLARAQISVVLLPAHTSDQTQPCDLGLFGNIKSAQSRIHVPKGLSKQTEQIIRMVAE